MILRVLDLNIPPEPVGAAGIFNALITEVTNLPVRGDYFIKKDLTENTVVLRCGSDVLHVL